MNKQLFTIKGTHCPACKKLIEKRLNRINGVSSVEVDFTNGQTVICCNNKLSAVDLQSALEGTEYKVL